MITLEKKFTVFSPNGEGKIVVTRKNEKGSWFWYGIEFEKFTLNDGIIDGCLVNFGNGWNIVTPLQVEKNRKKVFLNLSDSDLDMLCELAVNDFSAFKKEFCKLANVEGNLEDQDLEVEFATSFIIEAVEGTTEVRIRELGRKSGKDVNIHYNILELYEIPISGWLLCGRLVQKNGEQTWNVETAYLFYKMSIPIGTVEENLPLSENDFEPLKKEFVPLFEAMKSENFEFVEKTLSRVIHLSLPKVPNETETKLLYWAEDLCFYVFVDGYYWNFNIGCSVKDSCDKEIALTLRKLVDLTLETDDDSELRKFYNEILNCGD